MALADNKGKPYGLSFAINRSRTQFYRDSLRILGLGLEDKLDLARRFALGRPAAGGRAASWRR